jgi:hypothetical protein
MNTKVFMILTDAFYSVPPVYCRRDLHPPATPNSDIYLQHIRFDLYHFELWYFHNYSIGIYYRVDGISSRF